MTEYTCRRADTSKTKNEDRMTSHTGNAIRIGPENLPHLAFVLHRIGFRDPIFQEWGIGQRFGLTKPLTYLLEWHVRGFADGTVNSEVEISREHLLHLVAKPGPYYGPLLRMLRVHGISFTLHSIVPPDASYIYYPELFGRTMAVQVPNITEQAFGFFA